MKPVVRKRAPHLKSRDGCRTCRSRHVKCDETRPSCLRCTTSGRNCDGFKPLLQCSKQLRSICPRIFTHINILSDNERQALDFFRLATIFQLPCASATEIPWEHVALDLVYQQPAIAAVASACAGLHRVATDLQDHDQKQFALQQYSKSLALTHDYIKNLPRMVTDEDAVIVLVACLLLFTYETFSGHDARASFHLHAGLKIIYERCSPGEKRQGLDERRLVAVDPKPKSLFDVLVQTFIRLDSDYSLTGHDDPYLYPICAKPMPSTFSNPDEASFYLEVITATMFDLFDILYDHTYSILDNQRDCESLHEDQQNCLTRAALRTVDLNGPLLEGVEESRRSLQLWKAAFAATPQTNKNLVSHISTQIFFFCVWIWVETWRDANSVLIDRFESQFEYFTGLCEQYLELHAAKTPFRNRFTTRDGGETGSIGTPPAFSLGSGVVTCLAAIVEKCRTSSIRRRCVATLRKINLRGVFDTGYLVAYLQAIVEHEEHAARQCSPGIGLSSDLRSHDIPEAARLLEVVMSPSYHSAKYDFYKTKQVSLVYVTRRNRSPGDGLQLGEKTVTVP